MIRMASYHPPTSWQGKGKGTGRPHRHATSACDSCKGLKKKCQVKHCASCRRQTVPECHHQPCERCRRMGEESNCQWTRPDQRTSAGRSQTNSRGGRLLSTTQFIPVAFMPGGGSDVVTAGATITHHRTSIGQALARMGESHLSSVISESRPSDFRASHEPSMCVDRDTDLGASCLTTPVMPSSGQSGESTSNSAPVVMMAFTGGEEEADTYVAGNELQLIREAARISAELSAYMDTLLKPGGWYMNEGSPGPTETNMSMPSASANHFPSSPIN